MAHPHFNFTVEEIISQKRVTQKQIDEIKEWLNEGEEYPDLVEEQIVLFLLSCDCKRQETCATIVAHYKAKLGVPKFFDDRNVDSRELQLQMRAM